MTRYFWIATFAWPTPDGMATWSNNGTLNSDGTLTRSDAMKQIQQLAAQQSTRPVPANPDVTFFSIEPDVLPGGAQ